MSSIPLAIQPIHINDPLAEYSRAIGIRGALQAQQDERTMQPYRIQQAQQAQQLQQIQLQQAQQAQRDQQIMGQYIRSAAAPVAAPGNGIAAAAPAQSTAPATQTVQAAPGGQTSQAPAELDQEGAAETGGTEGGGGVAPAAVSGPPQGIPATGSTVSSTARAGAHPIDLLDVANKALLQGGLSYPAYQNLISQAVSQREALAKMNASELADMKTRHDLYLGRLTAFRAMPAEYQGDNWGGMNRQAFEDGVLSPQEYSVATSQYGKLPDSQHLDMLQTQMQTLSGQQEAALKLQQTQTAASRASMAQSQQAHTDVETQLAQQNLQGAQRKAWSSVLSLATTPEQYAGIYGQVPEEIQTGLDDPKDFDPAKTPARVQQWGMTPEEQVRSAQTAAQNANTQQYRQARVAQDAQRVGFEQQRVGMEAARQGAGGGGGAGSNLTAYQRQRESDQLSAMENGSGSTMGLHSQRMVYGTALANNQALTPQGQPMTDGKGNPVPLSGAQRQLLQAQYQNVTARVQDIQNRKASLMGIAGPPPEAVAGTKDNESVNIGSHVWMKRDGVMYLVR